MALFDLSSSWLEGTRCPLGARGYSRDGKKGTIQIEYGLLTDPEGRPVTVWVFDGNIADPAAFTEILDAVHGEFGLRRMVMVGDRGMITSARIDAIRELDGKYAWITALRAPAIRKLAEDDGPLQLSLSGELDLAEITSDDFPGERLIITGCDRRQLQFDFGLSTRKVIRDLIRREFGVKFSEVQVGRLLKKMGLSAQRPLYRAYQRDPERAQEWKEIIYPRIRKLAAEEGASIFFEDEVRG